MPKYRVAVIWQMWGVVEIEAESLLKAEEEALGPALLPNGIYISDSVQLDKTYTKYGEIKNEEKENLPSDNTD